MLEKRCKTLHPSKENCPASECSGIECRDKGATLADVLYMARRDAYFKRENANVKFFNNEGYIRDDLDAIKCVPTFSVNALYSKMYGVSLVKSVDELCEGGNYPYFEPLPAEKIEEVEQVLKKLRDRTEYSAIAYRYGFFDKKMWTYDEISRTIYCTVKQIQAAEEKALQRLKDKMPKIIGIALS